MVHPELVPQPKSARLSLNDEASELLMDLIKFMTQYPKTLEKLQIQAPKGILLYGSPGVGKTSLVQDISSYCAIRLFQMSGHDIFDAQRGKSEQMLRLKFEEAQTYSSVTQKPCILFIDEIDSIAPRRDMSQGAASVVGQLLTLMDGIKSRGQMMIIGATNRPNVIDPALRRPGRFDREVMLHPPTLQQRLEILKLLLGKMPVKDGCLEQVAKATNGYVGADLAALCRQVVLENIMTETQIEISDFEQVRATIGLPSLLRSKALSMEGMSWSDVGGLKDTKKKLQQLVEWPLKHSEKMQHLGITPPRGILFYGPPGCSKTTLARIIAAVTKASFFQMSGASMYSSLVGESEAFIRSMFSIANASAPSIIFIDEMDALVGKREFGQSQGDPVQERVLSTLLNEMDGIQNNNQLLLLGATNRPDLIDAALLRPGRFDHVLYIGPPDCDERLEIFQLYTRDMPLDESVDLRVLAQKTERYTGADIKSVCREASLSALRTHRDIQCLSMSHFMEALSGPTISQEMLEQYQDFSAKFG
ncbi:P-loop containing nucleoside triphosphate hydrolase protein [Gorgonomyces haynaldii]|nr:P-loop containing nucleoside triphosphate hydrolase protein [Gorgonomyces haynaldii]